MIPKYIFTVTEQEAEIAKEFMDIKKQATKETKKFYREYYDKENKDHIETLKHTYVNADGKIYKTSVDAEIVTESKTNVDNKSQGKFK
eukprot:CAMPEP_0116971214 /NCGR_PEP_ID=MMETSP0467-20121206/53035_1 /TAXON_ID=283647 /ORGANISM="Mesodinium pulex, Strain SPMC105" /LENGTH=87 /DNA_ID=CAMNT_0004662315 /DNA_START=1 /DNA_END=261 /DNA_ORIENTATION=-